MKRVLPVLCGALILVALWASVGAPRQNRTTRGVLLTPVVRIAGHRTAVAWGGNCLDCHPAPPVVGRARVAVSSASIHRTIRKAAYQHAKASVARKDKTASAKPSGRAQSAAAPASSSSSSPP